MNNLADWVSVGIAFFSMAFNLWLSRKNWERRKSVHWTCVRPLESEREQIKTDPTKPQPNGLRLIPDEENNVWDILRLMNNGNLQAMGVKLYCFECEIEAIQLIDDGELRGNDFPYVETLHCVFVRLCKPGIQVSYQMPDARAWFCVYWMEAARNPEYMRQDFKWVVSNNGRCVKKIEPAGHSRKVDEAEYLNGAPLVDEARSHGFAD